MKNLLCRCKNRRWKIVDIGLDISKENDEIVVMILMLYQEVWYTTHFDLDTGVTKTADNLRHRTEQKLL